MYYVRVGLHGPGWLYVLGISPRADVPLSTPRARGTDTSAGAQTCVWGPAGLPVCHGAESTRKDPRPEEKKRGRVKQTDLYIYIYVQGSPAGCGRCDIPGVTQVLEEHSRIL